MTADSRGFFIEANMNQLKRTVAIGFFDGVHVGHGALLEKAIERAAENGSVPAVLSFDRHPDELVFKTSVPLITDCRSREQIIKRCYGIDNVFFLHFDAEVMSTPWMKFMENIIDQLGACAFVVGYDFTCGARGEGTAEKIREYCAERGMSCDVIPAVMLDGRVVSSTYIRTLIENGEMVEARRFLGHPYCLSDTVHEGFHIGRKLDAPTVNMFFPDGVIVPRHGVYASRVVLPDESTHIAVTNVGIRPTFGNNERVSVESHIPGFEGNLYGSSLRIDFEKFIRPETKFSDSDALSAQIKSDIEFAENYFKTGSIE